MNIVCVTGFVNILLHFQHAHFVSLSLLGTSPKCQMIHMNHLLKFFKISINLNKTFLSKKTNYKFIYLQFRTILNHRYCRHNYSRNSYFYYGYNYNFIVSSYNVSSNDDSSNDWKYNLNVFLICLS